MFSPRKILAACSVFLLSTAPAWAVQINLSSDNIDQYFRILEQYVLPLMVVSTVVLFCGYLASRIFHRTVARRQDGSTDRENRADVPVDGTAAFLRELNASPPIVEPEAAARQEPKSRPQHPLLRRRGAAAKAEQARQAEAQIPAQTRAETYADSRTEIQRPSEAAPARPAASADRTPERQDGSQIPRLQAAFRRPSSAPVRSVPDQDRAETRAGRTAATPASDSPREEAAQEPRLRPVPVATDAASKPRGTIEPPINDRNGDRHNDRDRADRDDAVPDRREPTISVVQALKSNAPQPQAPVTSAAARARAIEIADSVDYIASIMQQGSVMLAERIKNKQGLTLQDVEALRISGFDAPQNAADDLHKLGGDAAQEILSAYTAVSAFNNVVLRLEQMTETAPLDEGWNELVRSRIAETIYAVGQVRKTLGIYRRGTKKPANTENKTGTAGNTPEGGADGSVPIGRRQV